jgi:hypothetical protein
MRWLLLLLLCACEATPPEGRFECESDTDCPAEMVCRPENNRCYLTLGDAGD